MRKRHRTNLDAAIVDLWKREVGELSSRNFAHRLAAAEDIVLRLDIYSKLEKHRGCVNTISFNADGDILISGSDDRRVILWDWQTGHVKLSFFPGHSNNVFQAKFMPYTDDRNIITCAADGQVRFAQILDGGVEATLLAKHHRRAHKLAIEPGSPHIFYTCGEDGLVQHFDMRARVVTKLFTCHAINRRSFSSIVRLNAIAIDPRNPNLFAVAGSDEYARLYDIRKYKWDGSTDFGLPADYFAPSHLVGGNAQVEITGLAFSDQSELLVSYGEEFIYLFSRDMGLGPNPPPASPVAMGSDADVLDSDDLSVDSSSKIDFSARGGPQVYEGHINCDTVKGVSFFGPGCEYVVSGSDCGRIFIWKKKGGKLIRVMEADKCVVNCIESHPHTTVLASCGIERDIKIWTPKALERAMLPTNIEQVLIPDPLDFFLTDNDDDDYFCDDDIFYDNDDDDHDDENDNDDNDDSDDAVNNGNADDDVDESDDGDDGCFVVG